MILSWNIKLLNHSPVRVVVIGRSMHRIASISSSLLRYKLYTYTYYAWNSHSFLPADHPYDKPPTLSTYLDALPSLVVRQAVTIVMVSSNQIVATGKQANHYWALVSQHERVPQQTEYTCDNSSMLTLCLPLYAWAII